MKINMQILYDALKDDVVEARCADSTELTLIRYLELSKIDEDGDPSHTVYVGYEDEFVALPDDKKARASSVIFIGKRPLTKIDIDQSVDVLRIFPNRNLNLIRRKISHTFESLSLWHDSMLEAILSNAELDELLSIGTQPIKNPMGLFSSTGKCITWSGTFPQGEPDIIWKSVMDEKVGFSPKVASICVRDDNLSTDQVAFFRGTSRDLPRQAVSVSILKKDKRGRKTVVGTLSGTQVWQPFTLGQISLLVDFASHLGQNESITDYLFKRKERDIVYLTEHMVRGMKVPARLVDSALAVAGLRNSAPYVVLVVDLENATVNGERIGNQDALQSTYLSRIVNNNEFSEVSFLLNGKLALVETQVALAESFLKTEFNRLRKLFVNLDFSLGCSDIFTDYRNVDIGFGQACTSINLGRIVDPQWSYYYFGDYLLEHLFDQTGIQNEPQRYCHSLALQLAQYDDAHDTAYLEFMECLYRHSGNKAKAAEELFIHRNTLTYRLSKVKSIAGIEQFNYEDRQFFLTSCRIIRWCRLNKDRR